MGWKDAPVVANDDKVPAWKRAPVAGGGPGIMDYVVDMARVVPGGLAQAGAAIAGAPGDIESLLDVGGNWIAKELGASDETIERFQQSRERTDAAGLMPKLPTSAGINKAVSDPFGGYYKPKTIAGEYAQTAAQFAPAALVRLGTKTAGPVQNGGDKAGIAHRQPRAAVAAALGHGC